MFLSLGREPLLSKSELHLVCGMAGAGKSTLARELEKIHSAVRLCPDEWIEPLLEDESGRREMDRIRPYTDHLQWALAKRLLALGTNVIWEQGFWHADTRRSYLTEARVIDSRVMLHYLDVPVAELKKRVETRNKQLPFGSFHVAPDEIDTWMSWFQPPDTEELLQYDEYKIYKHD